jgi:hypothetical protein
MRMRLIKSKKKPSNKERQKLWLKQRSRNSWSRKNKTHLRSLNA